MTHLHLQLLASKWLGTLERHQMELDEMRREIEEAFGQNECGNDPVVILSVENSRDLLR